MLTAIEETEKRSKRKKKNFEKCFTLPIVGVFPETMAQFVTLNVWVIVRFELDLKLQKL